MHGLRTEVVQLPRLDFPQPMHYQVDTRLVFLLTCAGCKSRTMLNPCLPRKLSRKVNPCLLERGERMRQLYGTASYGGCIALYDAGCPLNRTSAVRAQACGLKLAWKFNRCMQV